jgi:putative addiction module component (TIGR02574 family)
MSEAAEKLKAQLLELPEDDRIELANFIYDSLPDPAEERMEETEFDAMLQQRNEELESGKVAGVPAEQVMNRLREKFAK